ncbi:MAG TPA: cytochrome c-type biogenesis protein CcmH [Bryobacteraceae bacterium]|nr:cytochrome c-type biogenesis protein CcmH [Bryobacteraceae bacterium]
MKKWRNSFVLLLMAGLCIAQTGDMVPPEVRRVGDRLACLCGSCKNTVATCQMLGCHYSSPARAKISQMHHAGESDEAIVADFVKREGKKALAAPPAEGFGWMAWLTPPLVALGGLAFIAMFIRRNRKKAQPGPVLNEGDVAKYKDAAERELARFDE